MKPLNKKQLAAVEVMAQAYADILRNKEPGQDILHSINGLLANLQGYILTPVTRPYTLPAR